MKWLWDRVEMRGPDDCWEWFGPKTNGGYGVTTKKGKSVLAHRAAWASRNGEIPPEMCVCHSCDNPPCCNPAHLWLGTKGDNNRDRHRKGHSRGPRGMDAPPCKLNPYAVRAMRWLNKHKGIGERRIARAYGISRSTAYYAIVGETWGWLDADEEKANG